MIIFNGLPLSTIENELGKLIQFPSGEQHIQLNGEYFTSYISSYSPPVIYFFYESDKDFLTLHLLADALTRMGSNFSPSKFIVVVPYLPSSRADRVELTGESFSLKVYSNLLQSSGFSKFITYDVHSTVADACFESGRFINKPLAKILSENYLKSTKKFKDDFVAHNIGNLVVVAPDKGAMKRASEVANLMNCPVVYAEKHRDYKTGKIVSTGLNLNGLDESFLNEYTYLVVDDICAGGRTFTELSGVMQTQLEISKSNLALLVTHGLFNNSVEIKQNLLNYFGSGVYCVFDYTQDFVEQLQD